MPVFAVLYEALCVVVYSCCQVLATQSAIQRKQIKETHCFSSIIMTMIHVRVCMCVCVLNRSIWTSTLKHWGSEWHDLMSLSRDCKKTSNVKWAAFTTPVDVLKGLFCNLFLTPSQIRCVFSSWQKVHPADSPLNLVSAVLLCLWFIVLYYGERMWDSTVSCFCPLCVHVLMIVFVLNQPTTSA